MKCANNAMHRVPARDMPSAGSALLRLGKSCATGRAAIGDRGYSLEMGSVCIFFQKWSRPSARDGLFFHMACGGDWHRLDF